MCVEVKEAVEFYNQACAAEEMGKLNLAEVFYIKCGVLFEQAGGRHSLKAANALNALAFLQETRGNYGGAMNSAKQSLQIVEKYRMQFKSGDAELIYMQARDLINNLIERELSTL